MAWWRLINRRSDASSSGTDYYQEGVDLLGEEKFHEALTSFRLALRETANDTDVLQQIAVTYTHIGMTDEAMRTYRRVLELQPRAAGAHYGLAFLLLQRGNRLDAVAHLKAFLEDPPDLPEAEKHREHAKKVLTELEGDSVTPQPPENG
jgi:Flp pilus assembly protein TadD